MKGRIHLSSDAEIDAAVRLLMRAADDFTWWEWNKVWWQCLGIRILTWAERKAAALQAWGKRR